MGHYAWVGAPIRMAIDDDSVEWSSPWGRVSFTSMGVCLTWSGIPHAAGASTRDGDSGSEFIPWDDLLSLDLLLPVVTLRWTWVHDLMSVFSNIPVEEAPERFEVVVHGSTGDHSMSLGAAQGRTKKTTYRFVQQLSQILTGKRTHFWSRGCQLVAAERAWRSAPLWRRVVSSRRTATRALLSAGMPIR